jgi:hypothetical protein
MLVILKKTKVLLVTVFLLLCCSETVSNTWAADYAVGVKNGDWVKYTVTVTGLQPEAPAPSSVKVEILAVAGRNITFRLTLRGQNGKETNQTVAIDLAAESFGGHAFLAPANLTLGDSVNLNGGIRNITSETTRICAGTNRTVVGTTFLDGGNTYSYCFDKQTGIATEVLEVSSGWTSDTVVEDTNVWQSGYRGLDLWLLTAAILVIGVTLTTVIFIMRNRQMRHRRRAIGTIGR